MKNPILHIILVIILASSLSSCEEKKDPKVLMEERIEARLNKVKTERIIRCQKDALELAEMKVDSLIRALAKKMTTDTSAVIIKPEKPESPEFKIPADTFTLIPPINSGPKKQ
jgi:hypothetical protein